MKRLKTFVSVGVISVVTTSIGIQSKPAIAGCNPFGCSQSAIAECNPFGCPQAPTGQACTPFGCPSSPQPQQQQQQQQQPGIQAPINPGYYLINGILFGPDGRPVSSQPQPVILQPQPQQQLGTQVPINQGYNLVGGVWFGPDGKPVSSDRSPGEDQAACIARISFLPLQAYSRSETHGDYRYNRPGGVTLEQMMAGGLENKGGIFDGEKWRGSQPQVVLRVADSQEATIRCR
ncbi:MAG: hypothetical protein PUP92_25220 [Rhizonema sp. PD38]|nr:hypothetical protein [Rhizonema sp. PD38]